MKYEFLSGRDLKEDLIFIRDTLIKEPDIVFVYKSVVPDRSLDAYLSAISDKDLALEAGIKSLKHKSIINKLKICNEKFNLNITYQFKDGKSGNAVSMSQLLTILDKSSKVKLIFNNDLREDLSFVVQQLIYVDYPVNDDMLDVKLKKEEKDAEKSQRFMERIDNLSKACSDAQAGLEKRLNELKSDNEDVNNDLNETLDSFKEMGKQIKTAQEIEMEIEVAASKKTGKSVIVNSMIGEQLAPTSLTQATPNTCIYKKSPDSKYYLQSVKFDDESEKLIPTGEKLVFEDKDSIFKKVNEEFKNAEQNTESNFAIDDMEISYVNAENNFNSYTIYDTPGPDAAGTSHSKSAEYALKHSKVALFALDYTKYLTNDEFNYLNMVKSHFDKNNKFHSLVFALNKIDMRYTDGGDAKSVIRDTEFIRNRVISIDPKFKECIIFPTSALIYFNTLAAEKANIPELIESKCLEREFPSIAVEHGEDVEELVSLMNYTNNLSMLSGVKDITLETLKQDSGMPALLSYVSYIAKSKAREEIVNSITCNIDAQRNKVKAILDHIGNIEKLIDEDSETIKKITSIINEYKRNTEGINKKDFTDEDLLGVNDRIFQRYIIRTRGEGKALNYTSIFECVKDRLRADVDTNNIVDRVYDGLSHMIFKKLQSITKLESGRDIEYIISSKDLDKCIHEVLDKVFETVEREANTNIRTVRGSTLTILREREKRLQKATRECGEKLDKINCSIVLPEQGSFDIDLPEPSMDFDFSKIKMAIPFDTLLNSSLFKKTISIKNFGKDILRLFKDVSDTEYEYKNVNKNRRYSEFCRELERINFGSAVRMFLLREVKLESYVEKGLGKFDKYVKDSIAVVEANFNNLIGASSQSISNFQSLVDDRAEYIANKNALTERKVNINKIDDITKAFMNEWSDIVNGESIKKEE